MNLNEKRQYSRLDCGVPVLCRRGTAMENGQTRDISESGIGFVSQRFIPKDTRLIMEIALAPATEPLLALGKVNSG